MDNQSRETLTSYREWNATIPVQQAQDVLELFGETDEHIHFNTVFETVMGDPPEDLGNPYIPTGSERKMKATKEILEVFANANLITETTPNHYHRTNELAENLTEYHNLLEEFDEDVSSYARDV
jgi:hypothetical protein